MIASNFSYLFITQVWSAILLTGLLGYALRAQGLMWARRSMQEEEDALKDLEQEKEALAQVQHDLDKSILEQEGLCSSLLDNVERWRLSCVRQKEKNKVRHEALYRTALNLMHKRQETMELCCLQERVMPEAKKQAQHLLQEKFTSSENAHSFLSILCNRIGKERL